MNSSALPSIAAVVAAAGRSQRMGRFKPLLPWKTSTVIATVVNTLHTAGADPVVCVIGYRADELRAALQRTPAIIAYNPQYAEGEMLQSYQTGVAVLLPDPADAPAGSRDEALDRPQDRSDAEQFCGTLLAWATIAVPDCCRICARARLAVSIAKSASMIRLRAAY